MCEVWYSVPPIVLEELLQFSAKETRRSYKANGGATKYRLYGVCCMMLCFHWNVFKNTMLLCLHWIFYWNEFNIYIQKVSSYTLI